MVSLYSIGTAMTVAAKTVSKTVGKHSPAILAGCAVVGVAGLIFTTIKATPNALMDVEDARIEKKNGTGRFEGSPNKGKDLTKMEIVKIAFRHYILTIILGVAVVGCIVSSNVIAAKRIATISSACAVSEEALKAYKQASEKVVGDKKMAEIEDQYNIDQARKKPLVKESDVIKTGKGSSLCFLSWTGQYFESSIEAIRAAANDINENIYKNMEFYASLGDFQEILGLERTGCGDNCGFNTDNKLDLILTSTFAPGWWKDEHMTVIGFRNPPVANYDRVYGC